MLGDGRREKGLCGYVIVDWVGIEDDGDGSGHGWAFLSYPFVVQVSTTWSFYNMDFPDLVDQKSCTWLDLLLSLGGGNLEVLARPSTIRWQYTNHPQRMAHIFPSSRYITSQASLPKFTTSLIMEEDKGSS